MDRSLAAPAPRRLTRERRRTRPAFGVPRPLGAAASKTRSGFAGVWARRRLRAALVAVLAAIPVLWGGWLWLRHSSLVAVEHVRVSGLASTPGSDGGAIEAALAGAARGMSTLDVKTAALRAAVAPFPIVRSVRARASFPHELRIEVIEQPPVAALLAGGARAAVAADGVVLGASPLSSSLPIVSAGGASAGVLPPVGRSVRSGSLLQALTVLGAVPAPLAKLVTRAYSGPKGLTVVLRGGLLVYFGDADRPHAKWASLARVLADPSSAGAAYVDVRLPERPAAGFAPGTSRPAGASEVEASSTANSTTAAELAAGLDAAVGGGASSAPSSGAGGGPSAAGEPASTGSTPAQGSSTSSTSSEAAGAAPSEASSSGGAERGAPTPGPGG
ncbi:MAG TPA: cell division protein FtsQ/DivIB [Solirubrobacteraceae bacterium]|nr:cell division protein FtsQ/DivIB [Solirubrobacteraceae bacterium]